MSRIVGKVIADRTIQVYTEDGGDYNLHRDGHPNFDAVADLLIRSEAAGISDQEKADLEAEALTLIDVPAAITTFSEGNIQVQNGVVHWNGYPIHNALTKRILQMMQDGERFEPLIRFLENLMQNPSNRAVNELYTFMEANDMPISADGHLLAYKYVMKDGDYDDESNWVPGEHDFYDCHSRTCDYSPGKTVEMPRNMVDDNPNQTCSRGLHFASYSYVGSPGYGRRLLVVKVNPADVVSVPIEYGMSKARACKITSLCEVDWHKGDMFRRSVYADDAVKDAWSGDVVSL